MTLRTGSLVLHQNSIRSRNGLPRYENQRDGFCGKKQDVVITKCIP